MDCKTCGAQTDNPKFCSRSCAVTWNNHLHPKRKQGDYGSRKRPVRACVWCGVVFRPRPASAGRVCSMDCHRANVYFEWHTSIKKAGRFPSRKSYGRCKKFLVEEHGHKCQICGRTTWLGQPINLVFDHIDGDSTNTDITNCRLVCNNCDSTLPTYKGRNKGSGRHMRKVRYKQGRSY